MSSTLDTAARGRRNPIDSTERQRWKIFGVGIRARHPPQWAFISHSPHRPPSEVRHPLPDEQFANLREPETLTEPALDRGAMLAARRPPSAPRPATSRLQRQQDLADLLGR